MHEGFSRLLVPKPRREASRRLIGPLSKVPSCAYREVRINVRIKVRIKVRIRVRIGVRIGVRIKVRIGVRIGVRIEIV